MSAQSVESIASNLVKKLDKFLKLHARQHKAVDDAWYPQLFGDTKSSIAKDINKFLDDVLKVLIDDNILIVKDKILRLSSENEIIHRDIAEYETDKLSAPKDKLFFQFWITDRKKLSQKIELKRIQLEKNKAEIYQCRKQIKDSLLTDGISLTDKEIENILSFVTRTDVLQAIVVLRNINGVIYRLKDLMVKGGENIHIAKKYYGLFLLSIKAYSRYLELFDIKIFDCYMPKLKQLITDNFSLISETNSELSTDKRFLSNLSAQQITHKAALRYEQVLLEQHDKLMVRKNDVSGILKLAENSFKTVSIAHELYQSITENLNNYEAIMNFPIVDLIPFENKELEAKFFELTRVLQ